VAVRLHGPACRLTIFVGESDQYRHHPVYTEIVRRAHDAGLAGASVLRGIEGYGASTHIHTTRILSVAGDLPLAVIIVDDAERIRAFLPQLDQIVQEGLVILDEVEVIKYVGRGHERPDTRHPGTEEPLPHA
jgi:PII-like signaling protein